MKSFHFSLESVLSYKNQLLTNAQSDLARVNKAIEALAEEALTNRTVYEASQDRYREQRMAGITPQMMHYYSGYLEKLRMEYNMILRKQDVLNREKAMTIERIVKINIEVASLEKLKENEQAAHRAATAKEEERLVEEFIVYNRVSAGGH